MIKDHDECTLALDIPILFIGGIPSETLLKHGGVSPHITFFESISPLDADEAMTPSFDLTYRDPQWQSAGFKVERHVIDLPIFRSEDASPNLRGVRDYPNGQCKVTPPFNICPLTQQLPSLHNQATSCAQSSTVPALPSAVVLS
jgi:hypothetical protein